MKNKPLVIGIAIVVIALVGYLWSQLEYYEEEVELGYSLAAYVNPYLAAEQFLEEVGREVESTYQLDPSQSLPAEGTLFVSNANHVLDQRRADGLIEWMKKGGHVIVAAQVLNEGEKDVFLNYFGVEKYSYDDDIYEDDFEFEEDEEDEETFGDRLREANKQFTEDEQQRQARKQAEEEGRLDTLEEEIAYEESLYSPDEIARLSFENVAGEFRILIDAEEYLDHPSFYTDPDEEYYSYKPFYWQGNGYGVNFMQFSVEEGLLTVIGDGSIWNNERIGLFDHAYLLQLLTENATEVIFLRGAEVPNMMELIWQDFPELSVTLIVILLLWLVYRGRRFGPILDTTDRGRRSYREHLSAVGDFYWRHKQRDELLTSARNAIWREFNKKHFAARNESEKDKFIRIAHLTHKTPEAIQQVMHGDPPNDEFKFYQLIQILQQIRNQL